MTAPEAVSDRKPSSQSIRFECHKVTVANNHKMTLFDSNSHSYKNVIIVLLVLQKIHFAKLFINKIKCLDFCKIFPLQNYFAELQVVDFP